MRNTERLLLDGHGEGDLTDVIEPETGNGELHRGDLHRRREGHRVGDAQQMCAQPLVPQYALLQALGIDLLLPAEHE